MGNEAEAKFKITADADGVATAVRQAEASLKQGVAQIKGHFESLGAVAGKINVAFAALTTVLAGGAAFKEAIQSTVNLTKESVAMGRQLGITASQASVLKLAMGETHVSQEALDGAVKRITQTLLKNEEAFGNLGVTTRNANGDFRSTMDIMQDVNKRLLEFKEGTDRNIEGQKIYGKQWAEISATLRLTSDAIENAQAKAEALHLVVGEESVDATNKYRTALNDVSDVMDGVKKAIGDALLPVLTDLGEWFASIGPQAVSVMRGAMFVLIAAFQGTVMIVKDVWFTIRTFVQEIVVALLTLADVASHALVLDFAGAKTAWRNGVDQLKDIAMQGAHDIAQAWEDSQEKITAAAERMFNKETTVKKPAVSQESSSGAKTSGSEELFRAYRDQLEKIKEAGGEARENDIRADITFWQQKLALVQGNGKEQIKLRETIDHEIFSLRKKASAEDRSLDDEYVASKRELALMEVDQKADALRTQLQLGVINNRQEIAAQRELEEERYHIQQEALNQRLQLYMEDRVARAKIMDDLDMLDKQHAANIARMDSTALLQRRQQWLDFFGSLRSGFQSTISQFIRGTQSLGQTIRGLFMNIVDSIAQSLAQMAVNWAINLIQAKVLGKATAASQITANAGTAATAAMASVAAIPFYGWAMAPEVGATTFGTAMGYLGSIASAAQGYDIPAGVNPLTQLHGGEMVLPSRLADPLRDMLEGGGSMGGGHTINLTVQAIDRRGLDSYLRTGGARKIGNAIIDKFDPSARR